MAEWDEQHDLRIRQRAYRIWQDEGQPEGRAEDHWQLAECAIAEEDGLPSTLVPPAASQSETFEAATKHAEGPTLVGLAPVRVGHVEGPELKPGYEKGVILPRKEPSAPSVPPLRTRLTQTGRMNRDAGGWLWLAVYVVFVSVLSGALGYGIAQWKMRRRSTDPLRDPKTRELYDGKRGVKAE